jgi:hypothetical protein
MNLPNPTPTLAKLNPHLFCPLAQSGKQKAESGNSGGEAELHDDIFDVCRARGWIALHGSMAERTCRTLGEPDFTILADGGRVLFVECKTRSGKLSPAQAALKHHAEKLGHTVHVVRSLDEFLKLL